MFFSKQRPLRFQILCQKCVRGVLRIVVVQIIWKLRNWSHACTAYSGFAKRSIANQTQHINKCLEILTKIIKKWIDRKTNPFKLMKTKGKANTKLRKPKEASRTPNHNKNKRQGKPAVVFVEALVIQDIWHTYTVVYTVAPEGSSHWCRFQKKTGNLSQAFSSDPRMVCV